MRDAVESQYRRYVRVTTLLRRIPDALRLVAKIIDKAASTDSASAGNALGATGLSQAGLAWTEQCDVVVYIKAAGAHNIGVKDASLFSGHAFCSHAASLLQELRNLHRSASEKSMPPL